MYIDQTGRSLEQHVNEHRHALKNGDIQASALAEHVFRTGHAGARLSPARHAAHAACWRAGTSSTIQAVLNRERGTLLEVYAVLLG